ncbi:hypothetical protein EC2848050_2632 [Escherichia coli 2848050]|nr:hypothetical protein EC2848050_2632 [Escherichia coli 2848050]
MPLLYFSCQYFPIRFVDTEALTVPAVGASTFFHFILNLLK